MGQTQAERRNILRVSVIDAILAVNVLPIYISKCFITPCIWIMIIIIIILCTRITVLIISDFILFLAHRSLSCRSLESSSSSSSSSATVQGSVSLPHYRTL